MRAVTSSGARTGARAFGRWRLFALAFIATSLSAGAVYGWPPLRHLLRAENATLSERRLGRHFVAGSWSVQGGRFLAGWSRDRCGARFTACACLMMVVLGASAVATARPTDDAMLTMGMFAMGLGSGTQLCVQPVAALFPECSSTIMSALSGAFQISGLVFLALTAGEDREVGFYAYAGVAGALLVACWCMLPNGSSYHEVVKAEDGAPAHETGMPHKPPPRKEGLENGHTLWEQLRSAEYIGLVCWFCVVVLPLQFYISAIGYQLELKGDDTGEYSDIFAVAYGSVAIFAAYGGRVADKIGFGWCQALSTASTALSYVVLLLPASAGLGVQVFGMALYSLGRLFVFAMYFSNVGRRFGFEHFGTLCGIGLLKSAIWSLLQYPLLSWAVDKGPHGANALCIALLCATLPYTWWLGVREHAERRRQIVSQATTA